MVRKPDAEVRDDATRPPNSRRDPLGGAVSRADDLTILIADDDPSMRFLLALELRNRLVGVEILQAADGADAAALGLRHHPRDRGGVPPCTRHSPR